MYSDIPQEVESLESSLQYIYHMNILLYKKITPVVSIKDISATNTHKVEQIPKSGLQVLFSAQRIKGRQS